MHVFPNFPLFVPPYKPQKEIKKNLEEKNIFNQSFASPCAHHLAKAEKFFSILQSVSMHIFLMNHYQLKKNSLFTQNETTCLLVTILGPISALAQRRNGEKKFNSNYIDFQRVLHAFFMRDM